MLEPFPRSSRRARRSSSPLLDDEAMQEVAARPRPRGCARRGAPRRRVRRSRRPRASRRSSSLGRSWSPPSSTRRCISGSARLREDLRRAAPARRARRAPRASTLTSVIDGSSIVPKNRSTSPTFASLGRGRTAARSSACGRRRLSSTRGAAPGASISTTSALPGRFSLKRVGSGAPEYQTRGSNESVPCQSPRAR